MHPHVCGVASPRYRYTSQQRGHVGCFHLRSSARRSNESMECRSLPSTSLLTRGRPGCDQRRRGRSSLRLRKSLSVVSDECDSRNSRDAGVPSLVDVGLFLCRRSACSRASIICVFARGAGAGRCHGHMFMRITL